FNRLDRDDARIGAGLEHYLAGLDQIKTIGRLTFMEDDLVGFEFGGRRAIGQNAVLMGAQSLEERRSPDHGFEGGRAGVFMRCTGGSTYGIVQVHNAFLNFLWV